MISVWLSGNDQRIHGFPVEAGHRQNCPPGGAGEHHGQTAWGPQGCVVRVLDTDAATPSGGPGTDGRSALLKLNNCICEEVWPPPREKLLALGLRASATF